MFAERALTNSVGSGAKQEEKDLSLVLSLPSFFSLSLPSASTEGWGGGGGRKQDLGSRGL